MAATGWAHPLTDRAAMHPPLPNGRRHPPPRRQGWAWVVGLGLLLVLGAVPASWAHTARVQPVPAAQPQPTPPVRAGADTSRLRRNPKKQSLINKINRALQWLPGGANWPTIRFEKAESARAMPPTLPLASLLEDHTNHPSHHLPNLPKQL